MTKAIALKTKPTTPVATAALYFPLPSLYLWAKTKPTMPQTKPPIQKKPMMENIDNPPKETETIPKIIAAKTLPLPGTEAGLFGANAQPQFGHTTASLATLYPQCEQNL